VCVGGEGGYFPEGLTNLAADTGDVDEGRADHALGHERTCQRLVQQERALDSSVYNVCKIHVYKGPNKIKCFG